MYEIGQKVRVKSWEQMEREYGSNDGIINTPSSFTSDMRCFCGGRYKIRALYGDIDSSVIYDLETINGDPDMDSELLWYCWDKEMLIPSEGKLGNMIKERRNNV